MDWSQVKSALAVAGMVAGYTWGFWQWMAKRKADKRLMEIERRANAPFLELMDSLPEGRISPGSGFEIELEEPYVLYALRDEVNIEDGQDVIFLVTNTGEAARKLTVKLEGNPIRIVHGHDEDGQRLLWLEYPYQRAKHGTSQRLTLSYETGKGFEGKHIYAMRHGFRQLTRIDPQLPE